MSTRNEIDHLFSKKLTGLTAEPKGASWDQLNDQLNNHKKPIWVWTSIAASVAILMIVGWGWMTQKDIDAIQYSNIGEGAPFPEVATVTTVELDFSDLPISEPDANPKNSKKIIQVMQPEENNSHLANNNTKEVEKVEVIKTQMIAQEEIIKPQNLEKINKKVETLEEVLIPETNVVAIEEIQETVEEPELPKVTITYAQVQSQNPVVTADTAKFSLKKMFASAKKNIEEGGLMADLRGAKDSFIQGGRNK